jgi:cytidine deaminase
MNLIDIAKKVVGKYPLNGFEGNSAGEVSAALITAQGNIYTGICIDVACSLGFCAEHSAIAEMLKNRETEVKEIIAVREDGKILPPCGRCRELLMQINFANVNTKVIISEERTILLGELLPFMWNETDG